MHLRDLWRLGPRQGRNGRRLSALLAAACAIVLPASMMVAGGTSGANTGDWPSYLFNNTHSSYNPAATAITPSNLGDLNPIWRWISTQPTAHKLWSSPTVVDGVVYIGDAGNGYFYAVSEATQTVLWSMYMGESIKSTCGGTLGVASTATVETDPGTGNLTVYVTAPDGYVYALDAATGAIVWKGLVFTPSTTVQDYFAWASPVVANGNVYVGISSNCGVPQVPGGVDSFNQETGTLQAYWDPLPAGDIGASVWGTPAVEADGSIVVPTGNATFAEHDPQWCESLVELNGTTLAQEDAWQVPKDETSNFDSDFGGSPTLWTADIDGVSTPMVGDVNKNGVYYALKQGDLSAGPVWQQEITSDPTVMSGGETVAAAIWDGTNLIVGSNETEIDGVTYNGSIQSLNPATGAPIWQTGINGQVIGSPTEDGAGLIAVQVFYSSSGVYNVYLLNATNGDIVGEVPVDSGLFGQPVFANNDLVIGGDLRFGLAAYAITTPGPALTHSSVKQLPKGTTTTLRLYGSGFSGSPTVDVSGFAVSASSATVISPTVVQVQVYPLSKATNGFRNITVVEPNGTASICSSCIDIG